MAANPRSYERDVRGRFARPVPDVDAESRFDPMGDSIEDIENVSASDVRPGMEVARHAPDDDDLAQGCQSSPLRPRGAVLVAGDDEARTKYGVQGALSREAARMYAGPMDPSAYLTGADDGC
jgi:hypothetical protein